MLCLEITGIQFRLGMHYVLVFQRVTWKRVKHLSLVTGDITWPVEHALREPRVAHVAITVLRSCFQQFYS